MTEALGVREWPTTVLWRREEAFVAQHGRVVGVRWTGVPRKEQLAALARAHRLAREHGDVVVINDVRRVDGPTCVDVGIRAEMIALIETCHAQTRAVAHVIEIPGLVGDVVRAFLEMLARIGGRTRTSVAAFEDLDAAARWLHAEGGDACDAARIRSIWRSMERLDVLPMAA